jgi:hypothetical protein
MSKIFITFGAGAQNYYDAGERLLQQAKNIDIFDQCILYTDRDLKEDKPFWQDHGSFIENNRRGYGYWIWKPYLIKKTMDQCANGDMLLYCDSGCEIDSKKADLFPQFFEIAKQDKIVSTKAHCCIERHWNKMDLLIEMGLQNESAHLFHYDEQRQTGVILFYVCDETRNLVNKWLALASDYHLIDDTPSIAPNYHDYIEHRHDQSIFSLLTKQQSISSHTQMTCVEYIRNRTGASVFET